MGGNKASFNTNRTSFVPENSDALDYQRTGGCFVTTKKAIALAILALLTLILVGLLIYFFGTRTTTVTHYRVADLEDTLTDSMNRAIEATEVHLPPTLQPLHYRLRIHPYLQENSPNNFTFLGRVTITMHCLKMTKKIILNVDDLEIFTKEVSVVSTKSIRVKRAISEDESATASSPEANYTETPTTIPSSAVDETTTTTTTTPATVPPSSTTAAPSTTLPQTTSQPTTATTPTTTTTTTTTTKATTSATTTATQALPPQTDGVHKTEKVVSMAIQNQEIDRKSSRYVINLDELLHSGVNYTLDIKFSGKIENNLEGLYRTSYIGPQGRKRWILATQFFPNFARRVFPCFDEPFFKSSFEISIARRTNMTALSNMPLRESEVMTDQKGWVWDHFEKSPPMSPHLVAFTVCDYQNLKPSTNLGTVFKIWAPDLSITNAEYAMAVGPKILETLQNYFGVKYPLSKIDFVVAPELSKPATEGWGLIFFRDNALLLDPNSNSSKTRNHIFKTIAQKLTTQWFGNLVTMNFSDVWLNRGLSTYMEDVVEDIIEPDLEDVDPFALRVTQAILESDKLKSVKSLSDDAKDPRKIRVDDGTSNKGSCLIGMLNFTLSEAVFRNGLKNYLQKWKYQISTQSSLWDSFTEASKNLSVIPPNLSIHTVMDSWIKQEGYPVVTVVRNYTTGNAVINQTRFVHENENNNNSWYIPLTYTRQTDDGEISTLWLKKETSILTINFTEPGNTTWVIFNVDQAGFYRVNYDYINWKLLQTQLMSDPGKISPANRAQLLNDAFELATIGVLHYRIPFELTKYLGPKERNYVPWNAVYNSLQNLANHIGRTQYNGIFQQYVINLIKPLHDELGYTNKPEDSQTQQILRSFVVKAACENYYEPCLKWAKELYQQWMSSPDPDKSNPIDFDFRKTVSCTAIKMGGEKEWNFLWQRTQKPTISAANLKIAYLSLGCTREPWLITRYLELSLNRSISAQNIPFVWKSITHPVGLTTGITFLRMHWNKIYESYEQNFNGVKSIFEDFLSKLSTETDLQDLGELYEDNKDNLNVVSSSLLAVVDRIKWRMNWSKAYMQTVSMWLQRNI